jgi:hypothetical protein
MVDAIRVFDDVLPDVEAYRAAALAATYQSVPLGPVTFHGIAVAPSSALADWWARQDFPVESTITFLRRSPAGQGEPHYIHTDRDMGSWTAILYLTADPAPGDGTTFWRNRETGAVESTSEAFLEAFEWADRARWEPYRTVEAKLNRAVVFPAGLYHSRALVENYGETADTARLIQVMFGGPAYERRH